MNVSLSLSISPWCPYNRSHFYSSLILGTGLKDSLKVYVLLLSAMIYHRDSKRFRKFLRQLVEQEVQSNFPNFSPTSRNWLAMPEIAASPWIQGNLEQVTQNLLSLAHHHGSASLHMFENAVGFDQKDGVKVIRWGSLGLMKRILNTIKPAIPPDVQPGNAHLFINNVAVFYHGCTMTGPSAGGGNYRACNGCGIPVQRSNRQICSRCRLATYCSPECQKKDWSLYHNQDCSVRKVSTRP